MLLSEDQIQVTRSPNSARRSARTTATPSPRATQDLLLVTVLKGAVMFVTDLARAIPLPTQLEFMAVSSYGSSTSSSGVVRILKDLDRDINDRDVLIVEDIVDSGLTLSWLLRNLATRHPRSLRVCTLLRKPDAVRADVDIAYVGFDIPNEFVVGYGLDYAERYRDLPYIGTLDPKVYEDDLRTARSQAMEQDMTHARDRAADLPVLRGHLRPDPDHRRRPGRPGPAATATTCSAPASSAPRARASASSTTTPTGCARPLVRRDGVLTEATWDEAFAAVAERLGAVAARARRHVGRRLPGQPERAHRGRARCTRR